MYVNKQRVIIAESSQILRKGLVQIINQLAFDKVIELDENQPITEQITDYQPTIIIINPLLIGISANPYEVLDIDKKVHLVALTYTPINNNYLQHFDITISINDSYADIINKLKSLNNIKKNEITESEELSDREKEILVTLVKGMSNKEIADYHNISIHTVITHRRNITRKLNIHSPSGLTVYAIVNKLVDLNEMK